MLIDRRQLLLLLAGVGPALPKPARATASRYPAVRVYKDWACGCCSDWVKHIKANGFEASVENRSDVNSLKRKFGVPEGLRSCHTAIASGYVLEGHVPAKEIIRLLAERPKALGLAVPGMPSGAPGMDGPAQPAGPYVVMIFDKNGTYKSFASYE